MFKRLIVASVLLALSGCSMLHPGRDSAPVYLVFFRYDSAALTADARKVVDDAAAAIRDTKPSTVELAGYTDTTAIASSRHFAEPRFSTVAEALIADGIDPKLLVRVPLPEPEALLSTTADRRVEIRLVNKAMP
jgi:outer membrane protein OmpA-like peptidoglycan-associated protein